MGNASEYKRALLAKQSEFNQRIEALTRDLSKAHSADWAEQAQERENDEVLEALLREAREEITLVNAALTRLEAGDYGVCLDCGNDINPQRLDAYPEANKCIACAA